MPSKAPATGVKRTRGVAFGSGAADEDDSYGMMEDYITTEADPLKGMLFEIAGDSDEEDLPYVMGRYAWLGIINEVQAYVHDNVNLRWT